ncbi:MAG: hemerythrin domain-containing protein [Mizugakiibacter sp.]|uniref:hemerythrin domain-containing protein n=1 Tax=Mizugakiibacter sp. TaxID=1972610 RepID=UPI0031BF5DEB|nr:hypothetical protein [Xanthomonadaceae bacterium]
MRRAGALLHLSREHHTTLAMAAHARRVADAGDAADCAEALARLDAHWRSMMNAHCAAEELLLRLAADAVGAADAARIVAEHAELHTLAVGPCALDAPARLRRFAELTVAHVRYEERELFPQLQAHPSVAAPDAAADSPRPSA